MPIDVAKKKPMLAKTVELEPDPDAKAGEEGEVVAAARTLHVRCATWEQVEVFTTRKLRKGKLLSMKVPFVATVGRAVTLGLELPNEVVIAIDGVVQKAVAGRGRCDADVDRDRAHRLHR